MSFTPSPAARGRAARAIAAATFAFTVTMLGTTVPTPLYTLYAAELNFSPLTVTVLFAVYAVGVVTALLLFGKLSDQIGRRPVLLAAVTLAFASAVLFLLPPSIPLLLAARVVSGLGAGLMSGAGTAAVLDLFPPDRRGAAGSLAVIANTGGLAIGTLGAGLIAEFASEPLFTPFAVHLTLCALAFVGLFAWTPSHVITHRPSFRPQRLRVPREVRGDFIRAVLAAGSGFAVTGVLTAVSALFLSRELGVENHALAGLVVFLTFAGMAAGQLIAGCMRPRRALPIGCSGLVVAAGLLALALTGTNAIPLLIAAAVLGASGGICMNAGLATTVGSVAPEHRGEVSSSFFAGLYTMLALPAIGVGLLTNAIGLRPAGIIFAAAVAVLSAGVGVTAVRR
ncbi:MFS transporter [Leucobacter chromiireducens]|uniref:MFS transporter n=1 Tax=Leucobacter chromiireducens subsp. chromiireducens TaxID=660067 RepID=A0ABS1SN18_9MICO|nr:MFS transporter [Leucobacter chromiireducens]MBL3689566.1 MFS transporter [Leucobacter chromiireducens subsp. chromiireducens]